MIFNINNCSMHGNDSTKRVIRPVTLTNKQVWRGGTTSTIRYMEVRDLDFKPSMIVFTTGTAGNQIAVLTLNGNDTYSGTLFGSLSAIDSISSSHYYEMDYTTPFDVNVAFDDGFRITSQNFQTISSCQCYIFE